MRHASFPPKLREFVKSVEKNARAAGTSVAVARIFGAWAACFVRFCTTNDRSWREVEHVPVFLEYLERREDVDDSSRTRAAEAMVFLFEDLLKTDLSGASWHPDRQPAAASGEEDEEVSSSDEETKGEQSTLLTRLLFHTSLPINEALELCAGDVDLDAGLIYVSDPMGTPKQIVELPDTLHDPLRRHLQRLRTEHGPRYFDAPLFQARALQGRRGDDDGAAGDADGEQSSSSEAADSPDEHKASDRPASLWGYTEES